MYNFQVRKQIQSKPAVLIFFIHGWLSRKNKMILIINHLWRTYQVKQALFYLNSTHLNLEEIVLVDAANPCTLPPAQSLHPHKVGHNGGHVISMGPVTDIGVGMWPKPSQSEQLPSIFQTGETQLFSIWGLMLLRKLVWSTTGGHIPSLEKVSLE